VKCGEISPSGNRASKIAPQILDNPDLVKDTKKKGWIGFGDPLAITLFS